jgi:uncharacterized membrane protein YgaE (UPF0421/DUF939 family)
MFRSFLKLVQSPRPIGRSSILGAALYALQSVICATILILLYRHFQLGSAMWAVVSAVLVLQPGLEQSYGASATRFLSNLVGALTGAVVDRLHGNGAADVMVALVLVVGFCELLRLDQGLRSACASLIIVMMGGTAVSYATERRVLAVVIGCCTAMLVRIVAERMQSRLRPGVLRREGGSAQVDEG